MAGSRARSRRPVAVAAHDVLLPDRRRRAFPVRCRCRAFHCNDPARVEALISTTSGTALADPDFTSSDDRDDIGVMHIGVSATPIGVAEYELLCSSVSPASVASIRAGSRRRRSLVWRLGPPPAPPHRGHSARARSNVARIDAMRKLREFDDETCHPIQQLAYDRIVTL